MKVVALAGGVGGAKMASGLAGCLSGGDLTIVVNTGDDFEHVGLHISPDLDTVCYTLAGLANPQTGWGRQAETWKAFENLKQLGGPAWFQLGDQDLGTHLERTRRLKEGVPLSRITADFCAAWGIQAVVLPMSDESIPTLVDTLEMGRISFQEYFVKNGCEPTVTGFEFANVSHSQAAPGVVEAIHDADCVVVCPSNPMVSIAPMIAIPAIHAVLKGKKCIVAVSPIIGGKAVKGPAAKMFAELGVVPSALEVARQYRGWVNGIVIDRVDESLKVDISNLGYHVKVEDTLMQSVEDRVKLAKIVLAFASTMIRTGGP